MANGLFIQVYCEIETHPKFLRLCRLLGKVEYDDKLLIRAKLENLWMYAIRFYQDGIIPFCDEDISCFCGWKEESSLWINSLQESGFISRIECGIIIHDWEDYGGKLIKKREQSAERKRNYREERGRNADGTRTERGRGEDGSVTDDPKSKSKSKEEEEEKSLKEKKEGEESPAPPSCSEPLKNAASEPKPPPKQTRKSKIIQDESPIIFSFPVIHRNSDPEKWPLHQTLFEKFQDTYPSLDILQECKKAQLWTEANNRKTYGGMAKFLTGWMDRAQNHLRGSPTPRKSAYEQRFADVESAKTLD